MRLALVSSFNANRIEAKDLIEGLLVLVPEKRMTVPEILSHPWVREGEVLDCCIGKDECNSGLQGITGTGDISTINLENLFFKETGQKLTYADYGNIANDFYTHHLSMHLTLNRT